MPKRNILRLNWFQYCEELSNTTLRKGLVYVGLVVCQDGGVYIINKKSIKDAIKDGSLKLGKNGNGLKYNGKPLGGCGKTAYETLLRWLEVEPPSICSKCKQIIKR